MRTKLNADLYTVFSDNNGLYLLLMLTSKCETSASGRGLRCYDVYLFVVSCTGGSDIQMYLSQIPQYQTSQFLEL